MAPTVLLRQMIHGVEGGRSAPFLLRALGDSLREIGIFRVLCERPDPGSRIPA